MTSRDLTATNLMPDEVALRYRKVLVFEWHRRGPSVEGALTQKSAEDLLMKFIYTNPNFSELSLKGEVENDDTAVRYA